MWADFNLRDRNPDPGGGILYALRFEGQDLEAHRQKVIDNMLGSNAEIAESKSGAMMVNLSAVDPADRLRYSLLLEELSVTNDAIFYAGNGVEPDTVESFSESLKDNFFRALFENGPEQLPALYNQVSNAIPEIVGDIIKAHEDNDVLSSDQYKAIRDLGNFAATQSAIICGFIIIG